MSDSRANDKSLERLIVALEKLTDRIERLERATSKPRMPYRLWAISYLRDYGKAA